MRKCSYCGLDNADEATHCATCQSDLLPPSAHTRPKSQIDTAMSPEEHRFWERMTFRQLAILFLRMQAVWFLFYAVFDVTYLPTDIIRLNDVSPHAASAPGLKLNLFMTLLRVLLNATAALVVIQKAAQCFFCKML
jgi:hypothetical protein